MDSTQSQITDRLVKAGQRERAQTTKAGRFIGRRWAQRMASPAELDRLAAAQDKNPGLGDERFIRFAEIVQPANSHSHDDIEFYWQDLLGLDDVGVILEPGFVAGFVEGALKVWRCVAADVSAAAA